MGFDAAGGASTLTTTSTTVAVTFNNPNNLTLDVDATANYPDGGAGTGATRVTLTTMTWGSPFSWNPSCYTYEGSTGTGMNVTAPFIQGATYYWYLDGFLADVESTNTGTLWWTGESRSP
ncbi:hypothetical protein ACQ86N_26620 [Puia sp. P3]|uniref:hypothetical protein n=1 Tax=Puia sp. P3 TaxID=3423952 RepID=UPI003D66B38D